mgnify:FL=1
MGYTHYFTQLRDCTPDEWEHLSIRANIVLQTARKLGIDVGNGLGEPGSYPEVDADEIWFNGIGSAGYETFGIKRTLPAPGGFCKTNQNAYDPVVTAILILANIYAPGVWNIRSDGRRADWMAGLKLIQDQIACKESDIPDQVRS